MIAIKNGVVVMEKMYKTVPLLRRSRRYASSGKVPDTPTIKGSQPTVSGKCQC